MDDLLKATEAFRFSAPADVRRRKTDTASFDMSFVSSTWNSSFYSAALKFNFLVNN